MEKPSTARIALKWGIITAIMIMIYTVLLYVTGFFKNPALSWIPFILLLFGIIMSLREYKSLNDKFLNFSEGLGLGTLMSTVCGLIAAMFNYIYIKFIDTTIIQQMRELQIEQMENQGLSQAQIDQAMEIASRFATPGLTFIFSVIGYVLFGFVFSLVVSAIVKNSKPEIDF
ncbi:hypothetical protein Emtol_3910 [Emticicia oligotrophica DSM 17448]|uniref:DUF4199 domain-containing protein n=1 Tax=Emticicia oligotrophica (strain DSM 17448 / CIP 109782 / MTCC 6937 / GPTSA100-15) TaxID=929562 RepID=A0ABM5N6I8_EMTOG|nr:MULTISPECIES: DUF4199 domain-containing protein [Emticicia]AFK05036.1 hypothetical protein Emtol_3910 [Emticicia oligotrophica DSM 17448]